MMDVRDNLTYYTVQQSNTVCSISQAIQNGRRNAEFHAIRLRHHPRNFQGYFIKNMTPHICITFKLFYFRYPHNFQVILSTVPSESIYTP